MEEHLIPFQAAHILQHTLRSFCIHENSPWIYAVFWRILPRNHPPPNWDFNGGACRSIMNKRNWILVWEDGFCNFAASTCRNSDLQHFSGMHPEVFFKMSHEIYNYGEGLIGKVAAENRHDWVYNEYTDQNSCDPNPRTWNAQFLSGLQTIALIAVNEGVLQLGSLHKVNEELSYVIQLQRKFSFLHTIPGFLLPHPSMTTLSNSHDHRHDDDDNCNNRHVMVSSSMSSLEALLSKLPSVEPKSVKTMDRMEPLLGPTIGEDKLK